MSTLLIAFGAAVLYIIAYNTYGRFLAKRLFRLDDARQTPAYELRDDVDYCPTKKEILFGHHFTSIAGTGPIVGPALAVIWGWLPALLWVLFGSILMGAVHDLSAVAISATHKGRSIGDIAREVVNPRVRIIFLLVIFFCILIVLAIFGFVIAVLFSLYPESVFPIWFQIPIAMLIGWLVYRKGWQALPLSLMGVVLLFTAIWIGTKIPLSIATTADGGWLAFQVGRDEGRRTLMTLMPTFGWFQPVTLWIIVLLIYAYIASTLPVWKLLQPRDYLNSHQLFAILAILGAGLLLARPELVAPKVNTALPGDVPPLWPFLFITIACGAISGFHCMVGSGTTSKQLKKQTDALTIGYGSMLMEGMLATLVILATCAGIGMVVADGTVSGEAAWQARYGSWEAAGSLGAKVGAFIDGSANMLTSLGIPLMLGQTLIAVFVVSFAATTMDTATRLQRYVVVELAQAIKVNWLATVHGATTFAVVTAAVMALAKEAGQGGLLLWPLFGATNQLLACLALLVVTIWLKRTNRPVVFTLLPMLFMFVMTGWAMTYNLGDYWRGGTAKLHLLLTGGAIVILEVWMVIESIIVFFQDTTPLEEAATSPEEVQA